MSTKNNGPMKNERSCQVESLSREELVNVSGGGDPVCNVCYWWGKKVGNALAKVSDWFRDGLSKTNYQDTVLPKDYEKTA